MTGTLGTPMSGIPSEATDILITRKADQELKERLSGPRDGPIESVRGLPITIMEDPFSAYRAYFILLIVRRKAFIVLSRDEYSRIVRRRTM